VSAQAVAASPLIRRLAAVAVTVLTAAGIVTVAGSAGAQPQPTIGQVQAKLKKLTNQENFLIQRYDQVTVDLKSANQRLKLVNDEVTKDQAAMDGMRDEIAQIASTVYENGSMTSTAALLTSGDPQKLLSQSAILTHLSTANNQQLAQFIATDRQLQGAQLMAKRTKAAIAKLHNKLTSQKDSLQTLISQQQGILKTLTQQQREQQLGGGGGGGSTAGGGGGQHYHGPTGTQAEKAVAFAYDQLGCPYVFGGTGPCNSGFDCSGLTSQAWAYAGIAIPRTSEEQAGLPAVARSDLQPGDIIEFAGDSHVGIYVGGGELIDAPQPGMDVEKISLSDPWYASNYDGAVRP
jgi:cell wall-associated NlpC family hydrolase